MDGGPSQQRTCHPQSARKVGAFAAGDVRASENPDLSAVTTLFVREHNFQVAQLRQEHPDWTGDQLYQQARAIVGAEIENLHLSELRALQFREIFCRAVGKR